MECFTWDERKRISNIAKHGIDFIDTVVVFDDPDRIEIEDSRENYGETRIQTIGTVNGVVIFVVYTQRKGKKRIISVRKASKNERETYYESRENAKRAD